MQSGKIQKSIEDADRFIFKHPFTAVLAGCNVKWGFCIEWRHPCICMGKYDVAPCITHLLCNSSSLYLEAGIFPASLYLEIEIYFLKAGIFIQNRIKTSFF